MIEFFLPSGSPNMSDVMVTLSAVIGGIIAWRQKNKDEQLKARDETITFLKQQVIYLQEQIAKSQDKW